MLAPLLLGAAACEDAASRAWTWSGNGPSRSGLHRLPDGVLFGNEAGALVRLTLDGRAEWSTPLGREISAQPTAVGDTAVAATVGGEWVGADLETGAELWRVGDKPVFHLPLAQDGQRVFGVAPDGSVLAFSPKSGGTAWKRVPPRGYAAAPAPSAPPVVHGERLFVGLGSAGLFALDPAFGEVLWHQGGFDILGFLAEGERIYLLTRDGKAAALRVGDGAVEWQRALGREVRGGPSLARGLLWVATAGVGLVSLDPQDGAETWQVNLPGALQADVGEYRELVLVPTGGREGRLLGFRPGRDSPVVDVRADSALRATPQVFGERVLVQASDGRVLAWDIKRTTR